LRYFGTDLDAALKRWASEKDHLLAGYDPPRIDGKPSLSELANLYLADSRDRVKAGVVRADHTITYRTVLAIVVDAVGGQAKPDMMTPTQWSTVRSAMAVGKTGKPVAQATLQGRLGRCRAFLNWCVLHRHVKAIDTADTLKPPAKRLLRREATAKGKRLWDANDLRKVIDGAHVSFRPVLLLGINCGLGAADIAALTRSQWREGQEFLDCPRHKTGIDRRVWLWPETREALAAAVAKRAEPAKQKYDNRLLLTRRGLPWSRAEPSGAVDLVASRLSMTKSAVGVVKGHYYDLRRTFRTVASEVCDMEAIDHCMGHQGRGEGSTYLQGISDERIRRVCESVRTWLFGSEVAK
jgi:integrase